MPWETYKGRRIKPSVSGQHRCAAPPLNSGDGFSAQEGDTWRCPDCSDLHEVWRDTRDGPRRWTRYEAYEQALDILGENGLT